MTAPSRDEFIKAILRSRLVEKARLEERVRDFFHEGKADASAERLARFLIAGKDLTKYQAERLLAGRTEGFFLGGCKILERLGAGGMGAVYLAEQTKLGGRKVALKVLPAQHVKDTAYVARFHREACAVAELKHANVVQIYDVGQEGSSHFLIMELVDGVSLEKLIDQEGSLPVAQAVDIIEQTARGLDHAHSHGIVHRDIKPSNLMLEGETVKILDLGLAKKTGSGTITQDHKGMGTPDYMSPEQFSDAKAADARSDLYSLGCTWYHLLTGRVPFPNVPLVGKALAHLMKAPDAISDLRPDVPADLGAMLDKLMAKDPQDRFQTAAEFLAELRRWRAGEEMAELPKRSAQPAPSAKTGVKSASVRAPASGTSSTSLKPAASQGQETLVHRPVAGIPTLILYLIPVLGAMVLGGVYIGIRLLREQLQPETVIVDVSPKLPSNQKDLSKKEKKNQNEEKQPLSPGKGAFNKEPPEGKPQVVKPKQKDNKPGANPEVGPAQPLPVPKRPSKVWFVAAGKQDIQLEPALCAGTLVSAGFLTGPWSGLVAFHAGKRDLVDLDSAWRQAEDGDRLEICRPGPVEVGPLVARGKRLHVLGTTVKRPIIVFKLPAEPQNGRGLWLCENGGLTLENLDLYVDLSKRKAADPEIVLFELLQSNFQLIDGSITVIRGPVVGRSPVTAVKLIGERPWDTKAKGNAPAPIEAEIRNAMIRGAHETIYVDSRQAAIRLENAIVCSPGTVVHLFHTRKLEFDHQRLSLEMGACTLDTSGPVIAIDCRPFQLLPVPLKVKTNTMFFASAVRVTPRPALVCWQSPVDDTVLSNAIHWTGKNNFYFQRGEGLQSKTRAGEAHIFVEEPKDWSRVKLGEEAAPRELIKVPQFPESSPWHKRVPENYRFRFPAGVRHPGAAIDQIKSPRPLK